MNAGFFAGKYKGHDLRVEQAWLQGITGCNITVAVVDNGINIVPATTLLLVTLTVPPGVDYQHPDLWENFVSFSNNHYNIQGSDCGIFQAPNASSDYLEDTNLLSYEHGTRSCGVIAAAQDTICGVGVAHHCNLGSEWWDPLHIHAIIVYVLS